MMRRFCVTYARTSYMEIEIDAEDSRAAEEAFEELARTTPFACEQGKALVMPHYRVIEIGAVDMAPMRSHRDMAPHAA